MPDLHWTFPLVSWSSWTLIGADGAPGPAPSLEFLAPMSRRRMSSLSRMAIKVAHDCAADIPSVRMIFASRHGELRRSTEIIGDLVAARPVSPAAFSLSVLNAVAGVFGIARADRAPASALSAGAETLGYALLEAHAQCSDDAATPVLLVYADEPPETVYGADTAADAPAGALALLFAPAGHATEPSAGAAHGHAGRLSCSLAATPRSTGTAPAKRTARTGQRRTC
jgi:hypothetical protein